MTALILGRTNVGKSSLFNRLMKKKQSLVINEPGITRDLLRGSAKWWGHEFEVIDSGGLPSEHEKNELSLQISQKIKQALSQAHALVVIVDGKAGLKAGDFQAVKMARKTGRPLLLFVNKVDHPKNTHLLTAPFFELGPELLSGSFERGYGVDEIVEWIISQKKKKNFLNKPPAEPKKPSLTKPKDPALSFNKRVKIAKPSPPAKEPSETVNKNKDQFVRLFVIGRANSGKSLLCNQILKKDRMIVSSKAGTTLDTVTEFFSYKKKDYFISDNPGSRRGQTKDREKISFAKSRSELERADIALLVIDAVQGPGRQEARLVQLCLEKRKAVLLAVNKMDLLKTLPPEDKKKKQEEIKKTFHFCPDIPLVFLSAKTGYHKSQLFKKIESLRQKIHFKIPTPELNDFFMKTIRKAPSPVYGTRDVRFYYISQTNKTPPEFIAFANYPKGVTPAYRRFIVNQIKKNWNLSGVPVAFHALKKR